MGSILDMLALPKNQSWRLQQKGIILAIIGHQYSLHLICQLNKSIQTDFDRIEGVLDTALQLKIDQAEAPTQVSSGPFFYKQDALTGQYNSNYQPFLIQHTLVIDKMIINT